MQILPIGLLLLSSFAELALGDDWPSPQYQALEQLLYEGRRPDGSSLSALVHPCRKRPTTMASVGAEWLRFAFHDMATHNIDDGSGGMDGSLVYELERGENFGLGFNQTSADFELFPNKLVSRADVIAAGAIMAVATCGGPIIPFRGGRIDSWQAGGTGTPEPQEDINTITETFRKQGFTKEDMIKLVACGHTMGGVRSADFPDLVPANPSSTIPVITDFDTTDQFDNKIVTEYLDGTTQNVLVIAENKTMVSDLHVFESDGNSTMRALADAETFQNECRAVLGRMLDVVPNGVTLTDEVALMHEKVTYAQLAVEKDKLVFKANLRLTEELDVKPGTSRTVTMFWCDRYGSNKDCKSNTKSSSSVKSTPESPDLSPITNKLGYYFINYNFVVPISGAESISQFWFEVDKGDGSGPTVYNRNGTNYMVDQDQIFFAPMLSNQEMISNTSYTKIYTNRDNDVFYRSLNLVVAVRDELSPSRVYVDGLDVAVPKYLYAVQGTVDFKHNETAPAVDGYKFYTGVFETSGNQLTLDVHADINGQTVTQPFVGTSPLDNTIYNAPAAVSTDKKSSVKAQSTSGAMSVRGGWTVSALCLILVGVASGLHSL